MSDEMQIRIQETTLSARIKRKELATLLLHSSVVRASTRVSGVMKRKKLATLLLHNSVPRATIRL